MKTICVQVFTQTGFYVDRNSFETLYGIRRENTLLRYIAILVAGNICTLPGQWMVLPGQLYLNRHCYLLKIII